MVRRPLLSGGSATTSAPDNRRLLSVSVLAETSKLLLNCPSPFCCAFSYFSLLCSLKHNFPLALHLNNIACSCRHAREVKGRNRDEKEMIKAHMQFTLVSVDGKAALHRESVRLGAT